MSTGETDGVAPWEVSEAAGSARAEAPRILERLSQIVGSAQRYRLHYDRAEDAVALLDVAAVQSTPSVRVVVVIPVPATFTTAPERAV